jgi:hypothetical protein
MARAAAPFGSSFETIYPATGAATITDAATNLIVGTSGMPATITLPSIAQMVASQNTFIQVTNKTTSGGTMTIAANSADAIVGQTTVLVSTGCRFYSDGLHTWYTA